MTNKFKRRIVYCFVLFTLFVYQKTISAAPLKNDIAVTSDVLATDAAIAIYEKGGNAVDAAVASAFALNVVQPHNSGLGGGGFMLIYEAKTGRVAALDYRETAAQLAQGTKGSSTTGYAAIAVPGFLRGMEQALKQFGSLPLSTVMEPAIKLARDGFTVSPELARRLINHGNCLGRFEATREIFLHKSQPLKMGSQLVQETLAKSLEKISKAGAAAFYTGTIAQKIVAAMKKHNGFIREEDLRIYEAKERNPMIIPYREHTLYTMPLPSSGGILLSQMFQMIEESPIHKWHWANAKNAHLLAEVMKSAFEDRSRFLGDADFATIPANLTSPEYIRNKRKRIIENSPESRVPSPESRVLGPRGELTSHEQRATLRLRSGQASGGLQTTPINQAKQEGENTTHATFADHNGNVVSMTNSLNLPFGSCVVIPGTGILMNNHMDDFATDPNKPNAFGLIQGVANKVEAGKRPLSSMSPTIIFKDNQPIYALGTPGGPTIITNIFQIVINLLDHKMSLEKAIKTPKLHHQFQPDLLYYQREYPDQTLNQLREMGHQTKYRRHWGNVQAIQIDPQTGSINGVSDPRGRGVAKSIERLDVTKERN